MKQRKLSYLMNNNLKSRDYFSRKEAPAILFFLLSALSAPFFLLPLESLIGLDVLVEEIFKVSAILLFSYYIFNKASFVISSIFFGLFFAWTENIFYLNNFFLSGAMGEFWQRFFLTSFLHAGTAIVLAIAIYKKRYFFPLALGFNIALHYIFNSF